uniref:Uncharacterized protein n=1 Tax=Aegilops tauschii subsp. strangulata TaxID=200361 RepID=A0A453K9V9_AEGTS
MEALRVFSIYYYSLGACFLNALFLSNMYKVSFFFL